MGWITHLINSSRKLRFARIETALAREKENCSARIRHWVHCQRVGTFNHSHSAPEPPPQSIPLFGLKVHQPRTENPVIGLDVQSDLLILPEIKMESSDADEDQLLRQLYTWDGPKWKRFQSIVPNRTTAQLRCWANVLRRQGGILLHSWSTMHSNLHSHSNKSDSVWEEKEFESSL
jgi:hypothetical protein